jgi:hypothetical protein
MVDDIGSSAATLEGAPGDCPVALTDAMMRNA